MVVSDAACAFCRRQPVDPRWRPFCSERCQIQDLARWVDGTYRVPGAPASSEDVGEQEPLADGTRHES